MGFQQTVLVAFSLTVSRTHHIWESQSLLKNFFVFSSAYAHRAFGIIVIEHVGQWAQYVSFDH